MKTRIALLCLFALSITSLAQAPQSDRQQFIRVDAPVIALTHVRVIDGTGANPIEDQTVIIRDGKIASIDASATARIDATAKILDLKGYTVLPGLVGMHDHMFYPMGNVIFGEMAFSFPRLYLAGGVTTIRTTGSLEPYTDLEMKRAIDSGAMPGPHIPVTRPYMAGK